MSSTHLIQTRDGEEGHDQGTSGSGLFTNFYERKGLLFYLNITPKKNKETCLVL